VSKGKGLNKIYRFCQEELKVVSKIKRFSQEELEVVPEEKGLAKK
jgi:hypothetical protein